MALVARIFGVSLLTGGLGAALGLAITGQSSDSNGVALLLACVGGIIGALVGATREIVTALHQRPSS